MCPLGFAAWRSQECANENNEELKEGRCPLWGIKALLSVSICGQTTKPVSASVRTGNLRSTECSRRSLAESK